jgi:hypothetical protein
MVPSGMLRRVALVRTDVSEDPSASFIRVTKICELGTTLAATSVLTRATWRNIPEDTFLHNLDMIPTVTYDEIYKRWNPLMPNYYHPLIIKC